MNKKCLICGKSSLTKLKLKDGVVCSKCLKKSNWGKSWATTPNAALFWAKTLTFDEFQEFLANGGNYKTATENWIKKRTAKTQAKSDKIVENAKEKLSNTDNKQANTHSLDDAMAQNEAEKIQKMDTSDKVKQELIAAKVFDLTFVKKEIKALPEVLDDTETIKYACSGVLDGHTWLVVCTNKRVIFLNKNMVFGMDQKEIPLTVINAVSYSKQFVSGTVSITNGANVTGIEKINAVAAPIMAKTIREQMAAIKSPTQSQTVVQSTPDIPDEIRKYKQLLDDDIITQEEFDAKKRELLNL